MSRIAEMVEEEATRAEAEEPDADAEPDVEPDAEPEPEPPQDQAGLERALATMEKENVRHAKRVAEIMGADFEFVHVCPGCVDFAAGFTLTPPILEPEYRQAADAQKCPDCDGMGDVLTGAKTDRGKFKPCNSCGGQGWTTKLTAVQSAPPSIMAAPVEPSAVQQLRQMGYTIIEPFQAPATSAAQ